MPDELASLHFRAVLLRGRPAWYTAGCPSMSLKAKIEAVIYAAEEPVTLQQLLGLLGEQVQAEIDAADRRQGLLALLDLFPQESPAQAEPGEGDALNAEILNPDGLDPNGLTYEAQIFESTTSESLERDFSAPSTYEEHAPEPEICLEVDAAAAADAGQGIVGDAGTAMPLVAPGVEKGFPAAAAEPTAAATRLRERRRRDYLRSVLDRLVAEYRGEERGLEIREIAGGYRFATKPEYHDAVRGFVRSLKPPLKLSLQALETLAVVAYKQPVTAPEVSEVRGVDSGGVLGGLMGRKLVATAGRKQVIGRPILYKTTKEFLLRFGLKDVNELPSIEEFERMAADMNVALQEEIAMPDETVVSVGTPGESGRLSTAEIERDVAQNWEPSRNTHLSQSDGDPNPSTPSADEVSAEHLTPAPDGPSEFTGNESVPPAQNVTTDGRISGVPPVYDTPTDEVTDSPANDAAVQGAEEQGDL